MKKVIYVLACLFSANAFAGGSDVNSGGLRTYTADLSGLSSKEEVAHYKEFCKTTLQINTSGNVAEQVIQQTFGKNINKSQIEASKGSILGNAVKELNGKYLKRVILVSAASEYYKPAIYYAVTVTQFGDTQDSTGIEVSSNLLNFTDSAELAEDSICSNLVYKLTK